jgi:hypothetical protein
MRPVFVPNKEITHFTRAVGVRGLREFCPILPVASLRPLQWWERDHTEREARRTHPGLLAAIKTLGRYISREEGYDFPLFEIRAMTADPAHACYLWVERQGCCGAYRALGAASFQQNYYSNLPGVWVLTWVWITPEYRRRGLLSRAWALFTKRYGPLVVQPPISEGFEHFLSRQPVISVSTTETDKTPISGRAYVRRPRGKSRTALEMAA